MSSIGVEQGVEDSWKTEKFRKSVVDKINEELQEYRLKRENQGKQIEMAIYEKAQTKRSYLGYVAKIILNIRNMVCIEDNWLQNHVTEVLSKPPPKLRKVLRPEELGKYNIELMRVRSRIQEATKLKVKKC